MQFDELKGALTGLLILGAILVPAGLYLVRETLVSHAAVDGLDESQKAITDQLGAFIKVERLLGYTHFIHNFKNGVLRRDPSRLLLAKADIAEARQVLQQLLAFNAAMAAPVADLTRTLNEYDRKADLAGELIARGVAATDIDAAVKVDDTTAGAALFTIEEEITFARLVLVRDFGRQHALQQRTRNVAIVTAVGLIATALTLVWLYLLISRQSRALLATRERLADISRQFVGNVNGGAVDDDGSGDVRKLETRTVGGWSGRAYLAAFSKMFLKTCASIAWSPETTVSPCISLIMPPCFSSNISDDCTMVLSINALRSTGARDSGCRPRLE